MFHAVGFWPAASFSGYGTSEFTVIRNLLTVNTLYQCQIFAPHMCPSIHPAVAFQCHFVISIVKRAHNQTATRQIIEQLHGHVTGTRHQQVFSDTKNRTGAAARGDCHGWRSWVFLDLGLVNEYRLFVITCVLIYKRWREVSDRLGCQLNCFMKWFGCS